MLDPKVIKVIALLAKQTARGKIRWEPTAKENVYVASFPEYSVEIQILKTRESVLAVVRIIDDENRVIEEVTDEELHAVDGAAEMLGSDPWTLMSDLYSSARRIAMGVDEALDQILEELEDEGDDLPF